MKKYGYVIEIRYSIHGLSMCTSLEPCRGKFYQADPGVYTGPLRSAAVLSRKEAYDLRYDNETVRKVELYKNGRPKKVVKRTNKNSCKNCQTVCSAAKKNFVCDDFVLTQIDSK